MPTIDSEMIEAFVQRTVEDKLREEAETREARIKEAVQDLYEREVAGPIRKLRFAATVAASVLAFVIGALALERLTTDAFARDIFAGAIGLDASVDERLGTIFTERTRENLAAFYTVTEQIEFDGCVPETVTLPFFARDDGQTVSLYLSVFPDRTSQRSFEIEVMVNEQPAGPAAEFVLAPGPRFFLSRPALDLTDTIRDAHQHSTNGDIHEMTFTLRASAIQVETAASASPGATDGAIAGVDRSALLTGLPQLEAPCDGSSTAELHAMLRIFGDPKL